jgi:hypothetical protein
MKVWKTGDALARMKESVAVMHREYALAFRDIRATEIVYNSPTRWFVARYGLLLLLDASTERGSCSVYDLVEVTK